MPLKKDGKDDSGFSIKKKEEKIDESLIFE
jgi:hypothetical protein